ncbi:MAG TPA: tRNA (adenosine(37)-N6)-threonylcarbamoyltransferase complex ATPase subunit type 1 TsaE [Longimicrobiales bacterium]
MTLTQPELEAWGERIGAEVATPVFFALRGELGAGKSVLARAIARGAGVRASMPSPTFNLVFRYDGRDGLEVVHMDLYRLERADEVWELGWRELGGEGEIALVEWAERAERLLPSDRWDIRLEHAGPDRRTVAACAVGTVPRLPAIGD